MFMITLKASTRSCKTDWEKPRGYTLIERSISRNNSGTLVTDVYAKANKFISSDVIYTAHNSKGIAIYTAVQQTTIERIEMITFPEKFTLRGGDGRTGKQIVMNDGSIWKESYIQAASVYIDMDIQAFRLSSPLSYRQEESY